MNQTTFGKLIANGFRKFVIGQQTFFFKSPEEPVYESCGRVCKLVTDFETVQTVEEYVRPSKKGA